MLFRGLGLILGALLLLMSLGMMIFARFDLWVGVIIGPMFIYFALFGNEGLKKIRALKMYGEKICKDKTHQ